MPIETNDFVPLLDWLLGPGWRGGALFQTVVLLPLGLVAVLALAWLFFKLRTGSDRVSHIVGRVAALGILALGLVGGLGAWAWWFFTARGSGEAAHLASPTDAFFASVLNGAARLLGEEWFQGSMYTWLLLLAVVMLGSLVFGWLCALLRGGIRYATRTVDDALAGLVADAVQVSPRRVWALSWLAVREAVRRRHVVVVLVVFVAVVLFAGWFSDPASPNPARLCLDKVLTMTSYLTLLLALFLSTLSLPADIKSRTLHTVVTKPVRPSEIVLGRILGFTVVGSVLLAVMGAISYGFVVRSLSHVHALTASDLRPLGAVSPGETPVLKGLTSKVCNHQHEVTVTSDAKGHPVARVEMAQGHWHEITVEGCGKDAVYTIGPPRGMLVARRPIYGKLRFKDRAGRDAEKGVNVGDEWMYRSFIDGGTHAAAIWTFEGIDESEFPDFLPVEMTLDVFRTYKGDQDRGILGSLALRKPGSDQKPVEVHLFRAKKLVTDFQFLPRELTGPRGEKYDLFRDFVHDGKLEIWVRPLPTAQYFGMAQADLYLRSPRDVSFAWNFAKGYFGVWLRMVLVIGLGVACSTFLSGPVALAATLGLTFAAFVTDFLAEVASGHLIGGGPLESLDRIFTQQNMTSELAPGLRTNVLKMLDPVLEKPLGVFAAMLPDFNRFDFANYVSYGFNISGDLLVQCILRALAFLVPVLVAGHLFLKMREVAE